MTTSIQARPARSLGYDSFAHITAVPLLSFDANGLLFDGDLTETEIGDIWWWVTSTDDADQAARANLSALRAAVDADPSLENVAALATAVAAYVLGAS